MKVQAARLQASRIYRLTKLMYPDTISFENGQSPSPSTACSVWGRVKKW